MCSERRAAACLAQNSKIAAPQWHVEDDFPAERLGMALTVRLSADQSEHDGHESAGPPSSFSLRIAVSGTVILLQTQGEKRKREDRAGYDETANPEGSPGAR